jgi:hypothetical protein
VSGKDTIRLGYREDGELDELSTLDIRYDGWRSATGFNWQRLFGSRGVGLLGVTHSEAKVGQRVRDLARGGPLPTGPGDEAIAASPTIYFENSREGETTVKYDLTLNLPYVDKLQVGGSGKVFRIDYAAESPFGNDTPFSPVPGTNPFFLDTRDWAYQSGAYLQVSRACHHAREPHRRPRVDTTRLSARRGSAHGPASR